MVDSGIILIKYWLEVSPDEQTRRLESRIDDPRKIWKLSDMDLESYSRWDDYSRARDAMFAATDTAWAPWFVADTDDKKRGPAQRHHPPARARSRTSRSRRADVKLPKRQGARRLQRARTSVAPHPDAVLSASCDRARPRRRITGVTTLSIARLLAALLCLCCCAALAAGCGGGRSASPATELTMLAVNANVGRAVFHVDCSPAGGDLRIRHEPVQPWPLRRS